MNSVTLTLTRDHAELVMLALRDYAELIKERPETYPEFDSCGQLRYIATYIEHKIRDTGR